MGTAIIGISPTLDVFTYNNNEVPELSNAYINLKVQNNKAVYYAGFGWSKAGIIQSQQDWDICVKDFVLKLKNPLQVSFH